MLPCLYPLWDALNDMLGKEQIEKLVALGVNDIAPFAYMRCRSLANAFVVLHEAQITTLEQMMMFLTRLGQGSRAIITGDVTQCDLPRGTRSGLAEASRILKHVPDMAALRCDIQPGRAVIDRCAINGDPTIIGGHQTCQHLHNARFSGP